MPTLIDPDSIYPKRIGLYRGALVLEYYNIERDCFKKHIIPYDGTHPPDKIVENILKNPKHAVFLRKVAPEHLKVALSGGSSKLLPSSINDGDSQPQEPSSIPHRPDTTETSKSYQNTSSNYEQQSSGFSKKQDFDQSESLNVSSNTNQKKDKPKLQPEQSYEQSHEYSMNFEDEELSVSVVRKKQQVKNQHMIEEEFEYYDEDFEEISGGSNADEEKGKKQAIKPQDLPEEFQFLDQSPKKQKKKKKKKSNKSKDKKKEKVQQKKQTKIQEDIPIEEQFDFI